MVQYICTNPGIPLDNLIRVSNLATDKTEAAEAVEKKAKLGGSQKRWKPAQLKVGFGRTISETQIKKKDESEANQWTNTGYFNIGGRAGVQTP